MGGKIRSNVRAETLRLYQFIIIGVNILCHYPQSNSKRFMNTGITHDSNITKMIYKQNLSMRITRHV